jgi:NAD(P)-dependent dehydrogenase (short-subunit alcohol dehydrogenase family)
MNIDLTGKVIVVTGAAQGIGRALAVGLAAEGARVGVLARDRERAQAVVDELPGSAFALAADVGDEAAVAAAAAEVDAVAGRLDGLINNAGWMPGPHRVLDMDTAVLERVLRSNLVGSFLTTKHFGPLMVRGGGGRIVYMSSIGAVQATPGGSAYSAAKAGLNMLANVVHQELADDGVRTVAIAPGLTVTPGMRDIVSDEHVQQVAANYPGGRIGEPEDLVGLVAFLCSDLADHLSGTVITVRPAVTRSAPDRRAPSAAATR